ncbi:MAG: hypothetical protein M3211_01410 [Actinomycetota bacterium]|nr:hypothetical protein [Actinomycetota bacterium]
MSTIHTWAGSWVATAAAAALIATVAPGAHAAGVRDADRDGIPNSWERTHAMNPHRAADALRDFDHDRLTNLREYRLRIRIRDEDSDNDGMDDGDEVRDDYRSTDVDDRNTDDDPLLDGDEDADRDDVDNEDEDDVRESCLFDDDDRDGDSVDDEDENELHLEVGERDADGDRIGDGAEDHDNDGESNEDEDDSDDDACDGDRDDNGEDDEDENDVFGFITSYDAGTGVLEVTTRSGSTMSVQVTDDTEIDFECQDEIAEGDEPEATIADLQAGVKVAEIELDDDGSLEEVEIYFQA